VKQCSKFLEFFFQIGSHNSRSYKSSAPRIGIEQLQHSLTFMFHTIVQRGFYRAAGNADAVQR